MDFFASDDEISDLEQRLMLAGDAASAALRTALAWQLRQRDTQRALTLADQAESLLACADAAGPECRQLSARITLIRAEADWLFGRLDLAMDKASQAVAECLKLKNDSAAGDSHWVMACIWHEQGAFDQRDACLSAAAAAYGSGGDSRRGELVALRMAYHAMHRSAPGSRDVLPQPWPGRDPPMILTWKHAIRALASNLDGHYDDAVKHSIDAYQAACGSGQLRQAMVLAMGVGHAFEYLNDLDAASAWIETGLKLAETARWPALIGLGWYYVGAVMIKLNRPEDAMAFLRDAVRITTPFGESANYNAACLLLASELMKSAGNEQEALRLLQQGQSIALRLGTVEALFVAGRDLARLLLRLGRLDEAAQEIEAAMRIAREHGNGDWLLGALRVRADLQRHRAAPGIDGDRTVLACLDQALGAARQLQDFIVPPDLLEEVAAARARCGDPTTAYSLALEAGQSRERIHGRQASARAVAMQARHETVQLRAEAQTQRQLNKAQAQRADALQHSLATLEELGAIGRDITSSLYAEDLFAALHRHAQRLLHATVFEVFRFDAERAELEMAFGADAGRPLPVCRIALRDAASVTARCARERQDIGGDGAPDADSSLGGLIDTARLLYGPLLTGDQLLGVIGVRSTTIRAYGERERAIFRTLCAYGAIALANAQAMTSWKRVEETLVRQNAELELMAVTDGLTGLYNRLYLDRKLQDALTAARRDDTVFSLIILDMDQFKLVNDTHGHVAGDAVLVAIANLLKAHHRDADVVGRWGGEEFLVICPQTPVEGALIAAESLRRSVEQHDFPHVGRRTASFGVAAYQAGDSIPILMTRADRGLYLAKHAGRNRVVAGDRSTNH